MRTTLLVVLSALIAGATFPSTVRVRAAPAATRAATTSAPPTATSGTLRPPIAFEPNRGQAAAQVRFLAHNAGAGVFITDSGAVLALQDSQRSGARRRAAGEASTAWLPAWLEATAAVNDAAMEEAPARGFALRYAFEHAHPHPQIEALDPLPGRSNYFIGNDPQRWQTDIPQYARVRYRDVLPGVNVVYYGSNGQIEFDVELAPGADLAQVRLRVEGADDLRLDAAGDLHIATAFGDAIQRKPVVYQIVDGARRELRGGYALVDGFLGVRRDVAFAVPEYDRSRALVLDPTLAGSFLIASNASDTGDAVAADSAGNWYLTGYTGSTTFPTTVGAYQTTKATGNDAFVYKISNDASTIVYSTFLGGNNSDIGYGIGVDAAGIAYVAGITSSTNFPVANALQATYTGNTSAFVTALNASGNALVYSTYLGGNSFSAGPNAIAVDAAGDAFVAGPTHATDFPVSPDAFQTSGQQFSDNTYVFKFLPDGTRGYGTYIANDTFGGEHAGAIAIDELGNAYVAGYTNWTSSTTYGGIVPGAIGPGGGTTDAFVARLNAAGTRLDWITRIGGSATDEATTLAINASHEVFVSAWSVSPDLPPNTGQSANDWLWIGRLDETGTQLLDGRWLGAAGANVFPSALALDPALGYVAVSGFVQGASSLPALAPLASDCGNSCPGSGSDCGLFATFLLDANGLLQPDSVTRINGVNGAGFTHINGVAIAPGSGILSAPIGRSAQAPATASARQAFGVGVSDGTPPPLVPMTSGRKVYGFNVSGAGSPPPVLPPEVAKFVTQTHVAIGNVALMSIRISNPNKTTDITNFTVSDAFPPCMKPLFKKKGQVLYSPPSCQKLLSPLIDPSDPGGSITIPATNSTSLTLPAGTACTITLPFQIKATDNCVNTTNAATSDQGGAPAASARVIPLTLALNTWSGGGGSGSMGFGMNWGGGTVPGNGENVAFPSGVTQLAVNNDLPATQAFNNVALSGTGYSLGGNTFRLFGGINNGGTSNTVAATMRADAPLLFSSDPAGSTLNVGGGINLNSNGIFFSGAGNINIGSVLSGGGDVVLLGPGLVTVSSAPTFSGSIVVGGGQLLANTAVSEPIDALDFSIVRGVGPFGAMRVSGGAFRGFTSAPDAVSISSLTVDTGTVELLFSANNGAHSTLQLSGTGQFNGGTLQVDFGTAPGLGAVFDNLITAPGSITGCFGAATATPPNIFVAPHCTANAVGVTVFATDGVYRNGFQ